jgi:MarR family transcriptional regulator for hemolysin
MPTLEPIGLELTRTARLLSRAFDDTLVAVGGSLPTWLILTALKRQEHAMQREIAAAVGIEDATLTHHLNRMEREGLVSRHRPPGNRRNQVVVLTPAGEALFGELLQAVSAFDEALRKSFTEPELEKLREFLARLRANVSP